MGNHAITSAERIGHVLPRAGVVADKLGYLKGISLFYSLGSDTRGHTKLKLWGFLDKISGELARVERGNDKSFRLKRLAISFAS